MSKIIATAVLLCCFSTTSFAYRGFPRRINRDNLTITAIPTTANASLLTNTYWDKETNRIFTVDLFGKHLLTYSYGDRRVRALLVDGVESPAVFLPLQNTTDRYLVSSNGTTFVMQWDGHSNVTHKLDTVFDVAANSNVVSAYAGPNGRLYVGNFGQHYCLEPQSRFGLYSYSKDGLTAYNESFLTTVGGVVIQENNTYYHLDACEKKLSAFKWDPETGDLSEKRHVMDFLNYTDILPIGLTADTDGHLYSGLYNGSAVIKIDPRIPAVVDTIELPTPLTLAPIFGGPNNDVLFVTSGTQPINFRHNHRGHRRRDKTSGVLFMIEGLGVKGVPAYRPAL